MEWSKERKREFIINSQGYFVSTDLIVWVSVRETLDSNSFPARKTFYFIDWSNYLINLKENVSFSQVYTEGPGQQILGNKISYTDFFLEVIDSSGRRLLRTKCGKLKEVDVTFANQNPTQKQFLNWGFVSMPNLIRYFVEYHQKKCGQFRFISWDIEEHNRRAAYKLKRICNNSPRFSTDRDLEFKKYKKKLAGAEVLALCSFYEDYIA